MLDVLLESVRAILLLGMVIFLWKTGRSRFKLSRHGWNFILVGFVLLLFGSLLDITDNFVSLNRFIVIGDTEVEAFLEKAVGSLGGFLLLVIGLFLWIPTVERLTEELRERERAEVELLAAKEEAERANAVKSRFLAAASHDLRQPLQTLSMLTHTLSRTVEDADSRRIVDNQSSVLRSTAGLLDALLDVSKLEAELKPEQLEVEVAGILDRMRIEFEEPARAKGLDFRVVPSTAIVVSNASLLERIVQNFVANAIANTMSGKVLVGCRRRGSRLRIEVLDTGRGIAEDQQSVIFEEFYQLDNPARDRSKGVGLGLTIVERIATVLRHDVDVRSELGQGSVFAVEAPLVRGAAHGTRAVKEVALPSASVLGASIMLVEDDPHVLESTRFLLESEGFHVTTAIAGGEYVEQVIDEAAKSDLIIADHRLPGREKGVDVVRRIRKAAGHDIPAIVMTGDTSSDELRATEAAGCHVLYKPVDGNTLVTLIHDLVRR